uniref:Uncharacterized protein n=1 Tax=Brassica campestris TaxID=3711 RepID=M4EEH9_BRACM
MSDMTSLAASPSRSSKRAMYYVQSPSRDSYTSVTQPSTMMDSPTHDSYSLGRHSRNSSESRFSGISRSSSSDRKNVKKCRSNEKEYETILEEGSYEEMDDVTSIRRSQAILAVFIFISLFAFCCLITWGASRPYKAQISVQTFELRNFYVGQGSDFYGMHTKLLTLNGTLRIGIYNPAPTFGIHVSSKPVSLLYYQLPIATGQLKEHYQPKKSQYTEAVVIEGRRIPLYGAGASLEATERGGKIQVNLRFEVKTRGDVVGRLVTIRHKKRISCSFVIDVAIKGSNENLEMPFLTLFGIEDTKKTVEFSLGLVHGTVTPYYRSEPIPDKQNGNVVTVVGRTFDELVHTPWCHNSQAMSKQVEKLSKHFKGFDNLVFARLDASGNEHPKLKEGDDYPTILLLYKTGEKENRLKLLAKSSAKETAVFINEELKVEGSVC